MEKERDEAIEKCKDLEKQQQNFKVWAYMCVCVCAIACMSVCVHVCVCMSVCLCVCMYVCACMCACVCVLIPEITNTGSLPERRHVPSAAFIQCPLGHIHVKCCVHVFCAYCVLY